MKVHLPLLLLAFLLSTLSVHAQWYRKAAMAAKKPTKISRLSSAAPRWNLQRVMIQRQAAKQLSRSLCTLCSAEDLGSCPYYDDTKASAFVLEETYQGKTYHWVVTVAHYFLNKVSLEGPRGQYFPVALVAQGAIGMNDIALFPLPKELEGIFPPLHLASTAPKKGDKLHSFGFFDEELQHESGRIVTAVSPHRITTSLEVEDKMSREGACGGPVLNSKNEVVGVHAGSSEKRQIGFVLPAQHIRDILQAYHRQELAPQEMFFNGQKIGDININEFIQSISVWKRGIEMETFFPFHNPKEVDYAHLEELLPDIDGDKILLKIGRAPFSELDTDQQTRTLYITLDLHSGEVSPKQGEMDAYFY